jgi:hypothetical protein
MREGRWQPVLSVPGAFGDPPTLLVAGLMEVRGTDFGDGRDIALTLTQGSRVWQLGAADAGTGGTHRGQVTWTVRVPGDARQGPAVLEADEARLRVRIGGREHLDR